MEKFADTVGVDYATLRRYRWVSEQYEIVVRTTNLSWSHHDRIAARDDRLEWLAKAADGLWSVRRMLQEIEDQAGQLQRGGERLN